MDFDPFERINKDVQRFSIDPFAAIQLPGQSGLTAHLLKSTVPHVRLTSVLMKDGRRAGFVARRPEGCDLVSLEPDLRGKGLSPELLLATRVLRASLKYSDVVDLQRASKQLFCGGSYSVAGLASARAAHRLAVMRGVSRRQAIPAAVLADYAHLPDSLPGQKPPDCRSSTRYAPRRRRPCRARMRRLTRSSPNIRLRAKSPILFILSGYADRGAPVRVAPLIKPRPFMQRPRPHIEHA
ncbi:hypothetical protein BX592_107137 [Paraburkholderia rhizosphaerae]|uniref:Uncharacterized protein n=1 Tax=Paraburkholderia rhizosphaerae TaxID=480658 RepID=A0A4R8LUW5_9BURK|nr:hypothetical protein BX592_107137 [Paraburkholderia rhizosphaerae]